MAGNIKNFGLAGVANDVQLGKQGPKIQADAQNETVSFTDKTGNALVTASGANAVSSADFVTKAQLDKVNNSEGTLRINYAQGDGTSTIGTIPAGAKTILTTIEITTAFNGTGPTLRIGAAGNNELLSKGADTDITQPAMFQTINTHVFNADTAIKVYPNLISSTQGTATITVSYY